MAISETNAATPQIHGMIDRLVQREGGYVNHPADRGGPTRYGITELVARKNGYRGDMRELPLSLARNIYWADYVSFPGIDLLAKRSPALAAEALDTGVNMGAIWGVVFLQTALNALNGGGKDWPDLDKVDGRYGPASDRALAGCFKARAGQQPEEVLLAAMNGQQTARYLSLIAAKPSQEAFGWGWLRQRVVAPA